MPDLKGSKTHQNLKDAFAGESTGNPRYLYFAKVADIEGYPEVAGKFRETAEGQTSRAHGHLDYLAAVGDLATDLPIGDTELNLTAAVAGETHEFTDMYPGWRRPPVKRVSRKFPTGSRPWQRLRNPVRAAL